MQTKLSLAAGLSVIFWVAINLGGCGSNSTPTTAIPSNGPASALHATTEAEMTAYFRNALGPNSVNLKNAGYTSVPTPTATAAGAGSTSMSGTTLQEVGVDEADLVKSDGTYVYSLDSITATGYPRDTLRRQRLNGAIGNAALVSVDSIKIQFSANVSGSGFYLDAALKLLAVVGENNIGWGFYDVWFMPQSWGQGITEVNLIDTSSPAQMNIRRTLQMTGHLIGSRRLGTTLYLILRTYPTVQGLDPMWTTGQTAANQAVIDTLQAPQVLPKLTVDGGSEQPLVQATECFVQNQNAIKSADIITVVAIDLASATHRHAARCFTGGTEAFYMSDQSLYLATTQTTYTYSGTSPVYSQNTTTDIHKFALNGLDIAYRGSGSVPGHLGFVQNRKSFRMGEFAGALRVITQTDPSWGGWIATPSVAANTTTSNAVSSPATTTIESPGHLTILQENAGILQKVGELPNTARPQQLGKAGEQLYATRFIENRGYLVTYRLTDPLYILDLSKPDDPKIIGQLQVDGYSDYLFPLNQNLLLGVGKDAKSEGTSGDGRFAWYQGVKVSLIDVTDPAIPRETSRYVIGKRGTDATVLHDHHGLALQTQGNTVRVSVPMSIHESPNQWNTGASNDYFDFTRTELQRFEINLNTQSMVARSAVVSTTPEFRDITNDRSLLWNDQVHWYQNGIWNSVGW